MVIDELQQVYKQGLLTEAYGSYGRSLVRYALFKVRSGTICEELVQETFLKAWKYLVKGGEIKIMKAFLYHTLNHLIVDQYRKRVTTSLDALIEGGFELSDEHPIRLLDLLDGARAVHLIKKLPPVYREILRMRYVRDLSLNEISLQIGITKNAVSVRMHRGLAKLKLIYARGLGAECILPPA